MIPFKASTVIKDMQKDMFSEIEKKVRRDLTPHLRHLTARMNAEPHGRMEINIENKGQKSHVTVKPKGYSSALTAEIDAILESL